MRRPQLPTARDGSFSFFFKRSFRYENDEVKTKIETIGFKNDCLKKMFKKRSFSKTIFLNKFFVLLTIVNDDPSLTIVNEDLQGESKPT